MVKIHVPVIRKTRNVNPKSFNRNFNGFKKINLRKNKKYGVGAVFAGRAGTITCSSIFYEALDENNVTQSLENCKMLADIRNRPMSDFSEFLSIPDSAKQIRRRMIICISPQWCGACELITCAPAMLRAGIVCGGVCLCMSVRLSVRPPLCTKSQKLLVGNRCN